MDTFKDLKPMTGNIEPIGVAEREQRLAKLRSVMAEHGVDGLFLEPAHTMLYFLGLSGGLTERLTAAVIPAEGEIAYVCPHFERSAFEQRVSFGKDIRTWHEHESPYALVAGIVQDRRIQTLAIDERVRFFVAEGIRSACPTTTIVSGEPVVTPCRAIKSDAEIRLMQLANDITIAAYRAMIPQLREGMTRVEFCDMSSQAFAALGVSGRIWPEFGEGTAYPHGSPTPEPLRKGEVVLMDGGCTVGGYWADISRTCIFGEPTPRQREMWNLEKEAQQAAFDVAQVGATCESVDAAARKVLLDAGFGPGYETPGLPHRTGHGLGLLIHEPHYIVEGNTKELEPGMCFTNEPMLAIPGEFGIRHEDAVYITEDGPRWFSEPSESIETVV